MAKPSSTSALRLLSSIAHVPYARLERATRPLKEAGRYIHRELPDLEPDHLACLLVSLVSPLPSDAMQAVKVAENLISRDLTWNWNGWSGETSPTPDLLFPADKRASLLDALKAWIVSLSAMATEERRNIEEKLNSAGWKLTICLDPPKAEVSCNMMGELSSFSNISEKDLEKFLDNRRTIRWVPAHQTLSESFRPQDSGFELFGKLPFRLIVAAAEVYAASMRSSQLIAVSSGDALDRSRPENESAGTLPGVPAQSNRQTRKAPKRTSHKTGPSNSPEYAVCVCVSATAESNDGSDFPKPKTMETTHERRVKPERLSAQRLPGCS